MFIHDEPCFAGCFTQYKTSVPIPTGDLGAYRLFPEHRWVYNKLSLYETLKYQAFPHGIEIKNFPVFSKPIYNLFGMGIGTKLINSFDEFEYKPGHLWMPVFYGEHVSTDYAVKNGKIVWEFSMIGNKDKNSSFIYWASSSKACQKYEKRWIAKHLKNFTGIVNIESIGKKIIEIHLRVSLQFIDFYGENFISSMIKLYNENSWNEVVTNKPGYSYVVNIPKESRYKACSIKHELLSTKNEKIYYVVDENFPLSGFIDNDPHCYRIAVVNGSNKNKCMELAEKLKQNILKQLETK